MQEGMEETLEISSDKSNPSFLIPSALPQTSTYIPPSLPTTNRFDSPIVPFFSSRIIPEPVADLVDNSTRRLESNCEILSDINTVYSPNLPLPTSASLPLPSLVSSCKYSQITSNSSADIIPNYCERSVESNVDLNTENILLQSRVPKDSLFNLSHPGVPLQFNPFESGSIDSSDSLTVLPPSSYSQSNNIFVSPSNRLHDHVISSDSNESDNETDVNIEQSSSHCSPNHSRAQAYRSIDCDTAIYGHKTIISARSNAIGPALSDIPDLLNETVTARTNSHNLSHYDDIEELIKCEYCRQLIECRRIDNHRAECCRGQNTNEIRHQFWEGFHQRQNNRSLHFASRPNIYTSVPESAISHETIQSSNRRVRDSHYHLTNTSDLNSPSLINSSVQHQRSFPRHHTAQQTIRPFSANIHRTRLQGDPTHHRSNTSRRYRYSRGVNLLSHNHIPIDRSLRNHHLPIVQSMGSTQSSPRDHPNIESSSLQRALSLERQQIRHGPRHSTTNHNRSHIRQINRADTEPLPSVASFISTDERTTVNDHIMDSNNPAVIEEVTSSSNQYTCPICQATMNLNERLDHQMAHRLQAEEDVNELEDISPFRQLYSQLASYRHNMERNRSTGERAGFGISLSLGAGRQPTLFITEGQTNSLQFPLNMLAEQLRVGTDTQISFEQLMQRLQQVDNEDAPEPLIRTPQPVIDALPISIYQDHPITEYESHEDQQTCMVCLDQYRTGDEMRRLPCMHNFHVPCIDEWLKRSLLCPACKRPVTHSQSDVLTTEETSSQSSSRRSRQFPGY